MSRLLFSDLLYVAAKASNIDSFNDKSLIHISEFGARVFN